MPFLPARPSLSFVPGHRCYVIRPAACRRPCRPSLAVVARPHARLRDSIRPPLRLHAVLAIRTCTVLLTVSATLSMCPSARPPALHAVPVSRTCAVLLAVSASPSTCPPAILQPGHPPVRHSAVRWRIHWPALSLAVWLSDCHPRRAPHRPPPRLQHAPVPSPCPLPALVNLAMTNTRASACIAYACHAPATRPTVLRLRLRVACHPPPLNRYLAPVPHDSIEHLSPDSLCSPLALKIRV